MNINSTDIHQAALLAGVLTSTGSWPNILPNGQSSPWPVRTSWYCGIILSLFSILSAADQTVRLHRLSSHRDGLDNIRRLLATTNGERKHSAKTGRRTPSLLQILAWQMPVMFLTTATLCMIVGMFIHVWSATTHLRRPGLWDDNTKVCTFRGVDVERCTLMLEVIGCGHVYGSRFHGHCLVLRRPVVALFAHQTLTTIIGCMGVKTIWV